MNKIILTKQEEKSKMRRATVVVKPETYKAVNDLSLETHRPVEEIVNILLTEALKNVEVVESEE